MASWARQLGALFRQKATTAQWLWYELTGSEEERLATESKAGQALAQQLGHQYPRDPERSVQKYLVDIGERLTQHVTHSAYSFVFTLVDSKKVNAFALPGGIIFVTRGLIDFTHRDRDEVAFAVAHEIGHVVRQHAREKYFANAMLKGMATAVASQAHIPKVFASLSRSFVSMEYSQEHEYEADTYATVLLRNAGMNPLAGCELLGRIGAATIDPPELFRTHPPTTERVRRIKAAATPPIDKK